MRPLHINTSTDFWDRVGEYAHQGINNDNHMEVQGLNLLENWAVKIKQALIINNSDSDLARTSAAHHGLDVVALESFDLSINLPPQYRDQLTIKNIVVPQSHPREIWHDQLRIMNHRLDYHEVARIFDHMTAWAWIFGQTRTPTVILEANV